MHVSLALLLTAGVLIACGVYLALERTLSRVVLGFVMLGNGVNLLFIVAAGPLGTPPFEGSGDPEGMTDPLPFAMVLTAIVISLGVTAFGVALAYRAWQLFGHDEVPDDVEDRRVLRRSRRRPGDDPRVAWTEELTEESRRGALMRSQGFVPAEDDDPLGSDLSSAEDVPQDHTEADEGETPAVPVRRARAKERSGKGRRGERRSRGTHLAGAPGLGKATDEGREHTDPPAHTEPSEPNDQSERAERRNRTDRGEGT